MPVFLSEWARFRAFTWNTVMRCAVNGSAVLALLSVGFPYAFNWFGFPFLKKPADIMADFRFSSFR